MRAHRAARCSGLQLILGAEITPEDAPDYYSAGTRPCFLRAASTADHPGAVAARARETAGSAWPTSTHSLKGCGQQSLLETPCRILGAICFAIWDATEKSWHALQPARRVASGPGRRGKLARLEQMARAAQIPLLAAGDVSYHDPQRRALHEVLTATRQGTSVDRIREHLPANAQRHLRPVAEIAALFSTTPQAMARSREIAAACHFTLDQLRYEYPQELVPRNSTPIRYLTALTLRVRRGDIPTGSLRKHSGESGTSSP